MGRRYGHALLAVALLLLAAAGTAAADSAMNFKDADMRDVLRALGELAGVNVAADPQVQGRVTMFLQGMDAQDALELVVRIHGYDMMQRGNTVLIGPGNTLRERFVKNRAEYFPVEYASPEDVATSLRLLVPSASIQVDGSSRGLVVAGTEEELAQARSYISEWDVRERLVFDFQDTPLSDVFYQLARRGGYSLLLESPLEGSLTMLAQGMAVDDVIRLAAEQGGVRYRLEDKRLVVGTVPEETEVDGKSGDKSTDEPGDKPLEDGVATAPAASSATPETVQPGVYVDADLRDVLFALGERAGLNVLVDDAVQGRVSATLHGVDPAMALELVAKTNGYTLMPMHGAVVVGQEGALTERLHPVTNEFFPLHHVAPEDIVPALQFVAQPSAVQAEPALRGVLVRGTEAQLAVVEQFLRHWDVAREPAEEEAAPSAAAEDPAAAQDVEAGQEAVEDAADGAAAADDGAIETETAPVVEGTQEKVRREPPAVRVDGVVQGPATRLAVLTWNGATRIVAEGTSVDGLSVVAIQEDGVLLRTGDDFEWHAPIGGRE